MTKAPDEKLGDDLLWGAQAIADYLGVNRAAVYHMIRTKRLPIAKLGTKTIVASKKRLQRAIDDAIEVRKLPPDPH
jgi:excisionase family DNA binding protein